VMIKYLCKLQLIEHLEINFFNKVPRKVDGANPSDGTERSTTHIIDLIVA